MLFPIIIPRSYDEGGRWVGPTLKLLHPALALTWVVLHEGGTMTYVSHSMADEYVKEGVDFQELAMGNLKAQSAELLFTHESRSGEVLDFVAAMHEDGLGTSRLLLIEEWERVFPGGVYFGIPERSCAIVVPAMAAESGAERSVQVIDDCFADGTTPMLPGLHASHLFAVQADG